METHARICPLGWGLQEFYRSASAIHIACKDKRTREELNLQVLLKTSDHDIRKQRHTHWATGPDALSYRHRFCGQWDQETPTKQPWQMIYFLRPVVVRSRSNKKTGGMLGQSQTSKRSTGKPMIKFINYELTHAHLSESQKKDIRSRKTKTKTAGHQLLNFEWHHLDVEPVFSTLQLPPWRSTRPYLAVLSPPLSFFFVRLDARLDATRLTSPSNL